MQSLVAIAGVPAAQFATLTHQALVRVIREAERGLPGEGGVPKVDCGIRVLDAGYRISVGLGLGVPHDERGSGFRTSQSCRTGCRSDSLQKLPSIWVHAHAPSLYVKRAWPVPPSRSSGFDPYSRRDSTNTSTTASKGRLPPGLSSHLHHVRAITDSVEDSLRTFPFTWTEVIPPPCGGIRRRTSSGVTWPEAGVRL